MKIRYSKNKIITGIHILGNIYTNEIKKLQDLERIKSYISRTIRKFHMHELGSFYYQFEDGKGFTGIVNLAESHIAIHTWPEFNYLTLDVYICNYLRNNNTLCKEFFLEVGNYFHPIKIDKKVIKR